MQTTEYKKHNKRKQREVLEFREDENYKKR